MLRNHLTTSPLLVFFMLALIYSCSSEERAVGDKSVSIRGHLWTDIESESDITDEFAAYTYVLTGTGIGTNENAKKRYHNLIDAVVSQTTEKNDIYEDRFSSLNLFVIPAKIVVERLNLREVIDYREGFSKALIDDLTYQVNDPDLTRWANNPGPFLITISKPISSIPENGDEAIDLLFVDLSNTHPDAIRQVVYTYKQELFDIEREGVERYHSLRLKILDHILHASDHVFMFRNIALSIFG